MHSPIDRRAFLALGGATLLAACSGDEPGSDAATTTPGSPSTTTPAPTSTAPLVSDPSVSTGSTVVDPDELAFEPAQVADFDSLPICALAAESAAGPFPSRDLLTREDVTEGYPGHPLRLGLRVVDARCRPVTDALVEIWHTDATGDYSSFTDGGGGKDEGEGTTFMRGALDVDAEGIVEFRTIYPGWYPGRTVHVHVRVHHRDSVAFTGQLYFDDEYTAGVYAEAPYAEFGLPDTTTAADPIAGPALATGGLLALRPAPSSNGPGTSALANLGVSI